MRLQIDNVTVWPSPPSEFALPPVPMHKTCVAVPRTATADGDLTLMCGQPEDVAGNGRTCQIAELWLVVSTPSAGCGMND
jgi:hypothetical protein